METAIDILVASTVLGLFSLAVFFGFRAFNSANYGPEFEPNSEDDL